MTNRPEDINKFNRAFDAVVLQLSQVEDLGREGLQDTPRRIAKSRQELFKGYLQNPQEILSVTFETENDEMVVLKDIVFYSMCEHHLLPFFGKAHIGYIPQGRVVGLSKLARLVDCYARRLQIQEEMTSQIANAIKEALNPAGVAVVVEGQHLCMMSRGIQSQDAVMRTSAMLDVFRDKPEAREEFLALCDLR